MSAADVTINLDGRGGAETYIDVDVKDPPLEYVPTSFVNTLSINREGGGSINYHCQNTLVGRVSTNFVGILFLVFFSLLCGLRV